jgi:cathepsin A (carboxypeptidase C)
VQLLLGGYPVVVYSGDYDLICNWYGGNLWTSNLAWPGQGEFMNKPMLPWSSSQGVAGTVRSARGFTFVRVYAAGHMVPHDQPQSAFTIINNVITNTPFN